MTDYTEPTDYTENTNQDNPFIGGTKIHGILFPHLAYETYRNWMKANPHRFTDLEYIRTPGGQVRYRLRDMEALAVQLRAEERGCQCGV